FTGVGESQAQEHLGGLLSEQNPMVGITVSELGHITLRAVGTAAQVRARTKQLARAVAAWRIPEPGLAPSLIAKLTAQRRTITCAESVSGGHAATQLIAVPGASAVVKASFVTYADETKARILGIAPSLIRRHGAVSEPVVRAMALGARRVAHADIAVATTGIAGPGGATADLPTGTVFIAATDGKRTLVKRTRITGSRQHVQKRAAAEALLLAWQL
ncbi:MAG: nicotinamide-nucleotide amidohydrolase family protein, partial [Planctomycetota bacterium]